VAPRPPRSRRGSLAGQRGVSQQLQPDQGRFEWDYPYLGHTEVVCDRLGVCSVVVGRLARKHADVQLHRRPGVYRDHLRDVYHPATGDAKISLIQPDPGEDVLYTPGEPLIANMLMPLALLPVTPLQRVP
jgi:hypothetical protein